MRWRRIAEIPVSLYVLRILRLSFGKSIGQADAVVLLATIVAGATADSLGWKFAVDLTSWKFTAFALGAVLLLRFLIAPYRAWKEIKDERDALRAKEITQDRVDHLSELLDEGISKIWNAPVTTMKELETLEAFNFAWMTRTRDYLLTFFTKADAGHFWHLGVVPITGRGSTFNNGDGRHAKVLREYALREKRLRDIIERHTRRNWAE